MPRLSRKQRTPAAPSIDEHNRVLRLAEARALKLEDRLVAILEPILNRAGEEAATAFSRMATDHLGAAGQPGVKSTSTMICLKPTPEEAGRIAKQGGLDASTLHVTLAYLGDVEGDLEPVVAAIRAAAAVTAPLRGVVGGVGLFAPGPDGAPVIALPDVPGLVELRVKVTEALVEAGIGYSRDHGFCAHMTLDYTPTVESGFDGDMPFGEPLTFDHVYVVRGDVEVHPVPLVGRPPLTAAAPPPPAWGAPAADEVIDVDRLVKSLRTKTDPVRLAVIETTMKKSLNGAGIDFDVTNPLTAKVLAQSASQVTNIAETTRLNVMKTIKASYDEGLTIPDTATAIRSGMRAASPARARLIARTELAGAVNGGSLAATQIVSDATGLQYDKEWMTAPGAPNPRHELVDGLDGQTVPLDGMFDVEGEQLEFPGDPNGSPENVCNCRCTMSYVEPGGQVVEAGDAESGIMAPEDVAAEEAGGDLAGEGLVPVDALPPVPAPIDLGGGIQVAPVDYTETSRHVVVEKEPVKSDGWKGPRLSDDVYVASLQRELYSTNNVINYMNRKVKAGTATVEDRHRLEALRKRKEDVRALIAAPDPKGELSRVRNQINYMKRKVRDGSANHETHVRLGILEARAKELAALGKGDAGKIVKDTHAELKRINDEADAALGRAEAKRVQDARAREAEQAKAAVSYSSPTGVASLLIDKPIGTVIELPAHDIFMGMDAYKMGKSFAWIDKSGVVVKREADSAHDTATGFSQKDAEQTAAAYLESVPESMQGELQMITLARGYSPNDAYFQRTYKGFTHAAAQGGDGQMWFWQGYKTTFRRPSFDHEMGHIVGDDSGPRDVSEWSRAQTADQKTGEKMAEANLHNAYRRVLVGQRAVTEYGSNNNMEDWAESVRLWLESRREGRIAYKTDYATGQVKDLTFADVFPARARILDREFGP